MIPPESNNDCPLISVMMPTYNVEKYLRAAIDSVFAQTYENWELVIVDDGSTDATPDILAEYAARDKRIKIHLAEHKGRGAARNECVRRCIGDYVAICDSDDISLPNRFFKQLEFLKKNPDVGAVTSYKCSFENTPVMSSRLIIKCPVSVGEIAQSFNKKMRFPNAAAMIRRDLFESYGLYNEQQHRAQDYEFFMRLNAAGVKFAAIPEVLLFYRQSGGIPSLSYFVENGMYMAYADYVLGGGKLTFGEFQVSFIGKMWSRYYKVKYVYFYAKLSMQRAR